MLKPIVLNVETGHAIALIPASARLDLELTRAALDDPSAELASEKDIKGIFPEFEPGALPAVPSLLHIPVVIDRSILTLRQVTFSAGIQRESVRLETEQLLRGGIVTIAPISRSVEPSTDRPAARRAQRDPSDGAEVLARLRDAERPAT